MSEAYQFAIGRSRALFLAGCFLAAAALLFIAGTIAGVLYSSNRQNTERVLPLASQARAPKAPAIKTPEKADAARASVVPQAASAPPPASAEDADIASDTPAPTKATAAPAPVATSNAEMSPGTPSPEAATATTPAAAPVNTAATKPAAVAARAQNSYAIPLGVRVGSFSVRSNAKALMQSLRDMGYQPALTHSIDARGRTWYVVKLGPYTRWNAASKVAARISIAENVRPVIGPM